MTTGGGPLNTEPCSICGFQVKYFYDVKRHAESHNPKSARYCCPWPGCTRTTLQRSNMTTHMNKHTGAKPHVCPDCNSSFGDPSVLSRHRRKKHDYKPHAAKPAPKKAVRRRERATRPSPYSRAESDDTASTLQFPSPSFETLEFDTEDDKQRPQSLIFDFQWPVIEEPLPVDDFSWARLEQFMGSEPIDTLKSTEVPANANAARSDFLHLLPASSSQRVLENAYIPIPPASQTNQYGQEAQGQAVDPRMQTQTFGFPPLPSAPPLTTVFPHGALEDIQTPEKGEYHWNIPTFNGPSFELPTPSTSTAAFAPAPVFEENVFRWNVSDIDTPSCGQPATYIPSAVADPTLVVHGAQVHQFNWNIPSFNEHPITYPMIHQPAPVVANGQQPHLHWNLSGMDMPILEQPVTSTSSAAYEPPPVFNEIKWNESVAPAPLCEVGPKDRGPFVLLPEEWWAAAGFPFIENGGF